MFKEIVELQNEFNKKVHPKWQEQNYNWNSAIIAESGELLESYGYKWWKHQEQDIENVKVEAIDLLHFVISERIQQIGVEDTVVVFEDLFTRGSFYSLDNLGFIFLINELNYKYYPRLSILKKIFTKLEMSNEDIYIAYIVKNCLNEFRQKNGYKEGTYIKDWNGKEDNQIAYEIANEWGAEDLTYEQLMIDLEAYYKSEVLK